MASERLKLKCATCGKAVDYHKRAENPHFPFCAERCKLLDLGKWFSEEHRISEPTDDAIQQGGEGQ